MATIKLREPSYSELPQIAALLRQAFWDDAIFGDLMHPHRAQYPQDYERWFLQRLRASFWNARSWMLIAFTENGAGGDIPNEQADIVGFAQWTRVGPGARKALSGAKGFHVGKFLASANKVQTWIHGPKNRASDPSRANILQQTIPFTKHMWCGDRSEAWHLEILGVHPDHQAKGIGRLLVHEGLQRAEEGGIYASVTSAPGKDGFYRNCGFEVQEGRVGMGGEGNPLANFEGGNMWWKKP